MNVRFWLEADIQPHSDLRPLYPRKRTYRGPMSAPGTIADHLQSGERCGDQNEAARPIARPGRSQSKTSFKPFRAPWKFQIEVQNLHWRTNEHSELDDDASKQISSPKPQFDPHPCGTRGYSTGWPGARRGLNVHRAADGNETLAIRRQDDSGFALWGGRRGRDSGWA